MHQLQLSVGHIALLDAAEITSSSILNGTTDIPGKEYPCSMNCTKTIFSAMFAMESLKAGGPSDILASRMEDLGVVLRAGEFLSMLNSQARKPSQSGRSEPTAELAPPALSSRRAYIPAALTPDRPGAHLVAQSTQDIRLYSKGLFIPHHGDACRMTFS